MVKPGQYRVSFFTPGPPPSWSRRRGCGADAPDKVKATLTRRSRPADVIIYGTGFEVSGALRRFAVTGRGGVALGDVWREEIRSYYGIAVNGFPNFHMLLGPNAALGHNSVIIMIEAQVRYIMSCLDQMDANNLRAIDVKPQAEAAFFDYARKTRRAGMESACH